MTAPHVPIVQVNSVIGTVFAALRSHSSSDLPMHLDSQPDS